MVHQAGFEDAFITKRKRTNGNTFTEKGVDSNKTTVPTITYKIQFQASRKLYSSKNLPFEDVHIEEVNGLFKYFVGEAITWKKAVEYLTFVQSQGFKDAFIARFKDGELVIRKPNTK